MAALPFGCLSTTLLCAMVVQASSTSILFAELLPPSRPFRCLLTANRSPLPGSALQAPHLRTQPLCAMVDTLSGLGEQGWGQDRLPRSHSVLLPLTGAAFSSHQRMRLPSVPVSSPLGLQVPPHFLSSPFSFLSHWSCLAMRGSFLSFQVSRSPARVQKGLCEYCSISDVFSMHLWREMNSTSS
ncbi:unnamed protein product [Rangifer tarandus platyrhynchus]|uniref:Secreted protein n=1 Tax=Rangifer tarandus platyrhynchus TaxID=3082113 RepID=A0ABN8YMM6_RANTA|nr:unnamed protein product [Rangifer tarandus platyrhynchus]